MDGELGGENQANELMRTQMPRMRPSWLNPNWQENLDKMHSKLSWTETFLKVLPYSIVISSVIFLIVVFWHDKNHPENPILFKSYVEQVEQVEQGRK